MTKVEEFNEETVAGEEEERVVRAVMRTVMRTRTELLLAMMRSSIIA